MEEKIKKINSLTEASAIKFDELADVNTVVGKPIVMLSGFQIIPFFKVTMGNLSGGGEYGDTKIVKDGETIPFAGGSGSVVSMKPMGFLLDDGKSCRMLRVTNEPLDALIERAVNIVRDVTAQDD